MSKEILNIKVEEILRVMVHDVKETKYKGDVKNYIKDSADKINNLYTK